MIVTNVIFQMEGGKVHLEFDAQKPFSGYFYLALDSYKSTGADGNWKSYDGKLTYTRKIKVEETGLSVFDFDYEIVDDLLARRYILELHGAYVKTEDDDFFLCH